TGRQTWQGEAAEAADAKVEGFTEAGTTVCAETEDFAGAISPAMDGIQQVVREYASFVLELGKEMKCAGKTPQETQDEIRKARGDLEFSDLADVGDRKSTRLNSSHVKSSYAVFCLKKNK